MKLSVIVCLYNTKKEYLDKCLRSIRESTLKNDEYELLVIDDGSSESYDEIIKKYNPVYVKTPNRGLLSARLYGIMIAKGEYIAFCDSDDSVSFNYYKPIFAETFSPASLKREISISSIRPSSQSLAVEGMIGSFAISSVPASSAISAVLPSPKG